MIMHYEMINKIKKCSCIKNNNNISLSKFVIKKKKIVFNIQLVCFKLNYNYKQF